VDRAAGGVVRDRDHGSATARFDRSLDHLETGAEAILPRDAIKGTRYPAASMKQLDSER
jgi:hypothetical protein